MRRAKSNPNRIVAGAVAVELGQLLALPDGLDGLGEYSPVGGQHQAFDLPRDLLGRLVERGGDLGVSSAW